MMCGWVAELIEFEKLTPEQRKFLGRYLRKQKAEVTAKLEKINESLRTFNKNRKPRVMSTPDLHVIKRGA
jgi:hypothetical protein